MTTKYECDRCHRQTTNRDALMEVTVRTKDGWGERIAVRHYCSFCSLIMNNAICIVDDGTYTGLVSSHAKIGERLGKDYEKADPFYNKDLELCE